VEEAEAYIPNYWGYSERNPERAATDPERAKQLDLLQAALGIDIDNENDDSMIRLSN